MPSYIDDWQGINLDPQTSGGICPSNCGGKKNGNCTACGKQDFCPNGYIDTKNKNAPHDAQICIKLGTDTKKNPVYKAFFTMDEAYNYARNFVPNKNTKNVVPPNPCGPRYALGDTNNACYFTG